MRAFILPFLIFLILQSCRSNEVAEVEDVNQDKVYLIYEIDFNREKAYTEAEAQFRFGGVGGTTLRLSEPSIILLNDRKMEGASHFFRGWLYSQQHPLESSYDFLYVNHDKDTLINTFIIPDFGVFDIPKAFSPESDSIGLKPLSIINDGHITLRFSTADTLQEIQLNDPIPKYVDVPHSLFNGGDSLYIQQSVEYTIKPTASTSAGGEAHIKLTTEKFAVPVQLIE